MAKTVNVTPGGTPAWLHVSQYDVGRSLSVQLKDGDEYYEIPSGSVVTIQGTKPSGFGFSETCSYTGSTVSFTSTATMTDESGRILTEFSIKKGETVIGTANFVLDVEQSPHPKEVPDGNKDTLIPELTILVQRIETAARSAEESADEVVANAAAALAAKEAAEYAAEQAASVYSLAGDVTFSVNEEDGHVTMWFTESE